LPGTMLGPSITPISRRNCGSASACRCAMRCSMRFSGVLTLATTIATSTSTRTVARTIQIMRPLSYDPSSRTRNPMPAPTDRSPVPIWTALAALIAAFALSHAFRTVITLVALPLRDELGLRDDAIGLVGGAFHLAFGIMQLPIGIMLDQYGPRRTILAAFPAAVIGAAVTATATGVPALLVGQWLIGIGCAPCFLATLIVISRSRPPAEF